MLSVKSKKPAIMAIVNSVATLGLNFVFNRKLKTPSTVNCLK